jgi:non-specific protein-tyrosine kinase
MDESEISSIDVRRYLELLWHWAWLLILATILPAVITYLYTSQLTPVYQATTLVFVNEASSANLSTDASSVITSKALAQTYSQLITARPILELVAQKMELPPAFASRLQSMIGVNLIKDTQLIQIYVEDTNPKRAADIANTLVQVFAEQNQADQMGRYSALKQNLEIQIDQLQQQIQDTNAQLSSLPNQASNQVQRDQLTTTLAQYRQSYNFFTQTYLSLQLTESKSVSNIIQKDPAVQPSFPIRPRAFQSTVQNGLIGLVLGVMLIFLVDALNDTLQDPQEIVNRFGIPVLGVIMSHKVKERKMIILSEPRAPVSEAFRSLRTNLKFASVDKPIHVLLITSASPSDGKSTVATNLAICFAQNDLNVVLLEADLRKPMVHRKLGVPNQKGISELFMQSEISLNGNLQETETPRLRALTSGRLPPNPAELLGSAKMGQIIDHLRTETDLIVVDSPPVTAVTDAAVLAPRVDGVLLVVRPGITKRQAFKQSLEQLRHVGANILGVVLNDVDMSHSTYNYYYRGYYHSDQYYQTKAGENSVISKTLRWLNPKKRISKIGDENGDRS